MARPYSVNTELPTQYTVPKHVYAIGKCIDRISNAIPLQHRQGFNQCYYNHLTIHGISQTLYLPFSSPSTILNIVRKSVRYALDKVILLQEQNVEELKMRIMAMFDALIDCLEDVLDPVNSLNIPDLTISTTHDGPVPLVSAQSSSPVETFSQVVKKARPTQIGNPSTRTSQTQPPVNTAGKTVMKKEHKAPVKKVQLEADRLPDLRNRARTLLGSRVFDFCKLPSCEKCKYILENWPLSPCDSSCNHADIGGWYIHFNSSMRKMFRRFHPSTTLEQLKGKRPTGEHLTLGPLTTSEPTTSTLRRSPTRTDPSSEEKTIKRKRLADNPNDWAAIVDCASISSSLSSLVDSVDGDDCPKNPRLQTE